MAYKGVDISYWNGNIDINALSSQLDFFIVRGYAGASKDSKCDRSVSLIIENNKPYGLYIYSYALTVAQADQEARRLVALANTYSVKPNFLVIDMEDADGYKARHGMPSNQTLKDICSTECQIFEEAGYHSMIYASSGWFKNQLAGLNQYEKWVAHWPVSGGKQKGNNVDPSGENANNCAIWQYTSDGTLNGYNGRLDLNYAYKDFVVNSSIINPTPNPSPILKSNEEIAQEVKDGKWGNGEERKKALIAAGYDYNAIQDIINRGYNKPEQQVTLYTVIRGDSLSRIGAKYNVNWKDIANLNNIVSPYIIYTGQVLRIPSANSSTSQPVQPTSRTYTVKSGDTLSGIGVKVGVNWKTIANLNGIKSPYIIYPGQVLKLN